MYKQKSDNSEEYKRLVVALEKLVRVVETGGTDWQVVKAAKEYVKIGLRYTAPTTPVDD